jgi:hypothetical protein
MQLRCPCGCRRRVGQLGLYQCVQRLDRLPRVDCQTGASSGTRPQAASCQDALPRRAGSVVCPRLRCAPASGRRGGRAHPANWPGRPRASPHAGAGGRRSKPAGVRPGLPGSCHGQGQFQPRDEGVFHAVAQAPVTAHAQSCGGIPQVALAQGLQGACVVPALQFGMGGSVMPVISAKALRSLASTRAGSSSRCSADHSGLACTSSARSGCSGWTIRATQACGGVCCALHSIAGRGW